MGRAGGGFATKDISLSLSSFLTPITNDPVQWFHICNCEGHMREDKMRVKDKPIF